MNGPDDDPFARSLLSQTAVSIVTISALIWAGVSEFAGMSLLAWPTSFYALACRQYMCDLECHPVQNYVVRHALVIKARLVAQDSQSIRIADVHL
jgi:hypothetical protein